jgi:hypothetical protein
MTWPFLKLHKETTRKEKTEKNKYWIAREKLGVYLRTVEFHALQ